uniref:DUF4440 domain-containing protein n=1 Tax=Panagrolaimus sp. JU765 TaxID=591449 RepID=A0AC34RJM4_9BILA
MAPRSSEELKSFIEGMLAKFDVAWKAKDAKAMSEFYHPDGVLISHGKWCVYGRKDIEAKYAEMYKLDCEYKVFIDENTETENGEYIVHKGRFECSVKPGESFTYQQIYQKQSDGSYLVYHEEFDE